MTILSIYSGNVMFHITKLQCLLFGSCCQKKESKYLEIL